MTVDGKRPVRGRDATQMRALNARALLNIVRHESEISRADIARRTGLSPPTVSSIVHELEAAGYLEQRSRRVGGVGSPATLYGLRPGAAYSVGIHIGRRSTSMLLLDMAGAVLRLAEHSYEVPRTAEIAERVDRAWQTWRAEVPGLEERYVGTGICSPRFFDYAAEDIGYPASVVAEWAGFQAKHAFPRLAVRPIFEENDVNAAALAELEWGNGTQVRNFFYIYIGTFIGGGLVLDGTLVRGPQGLAATFGSFPVTASTLPTVRRGGADGDYLYGRASLFVLLDLLRHNGISGAREADLEAPLADWAPLIEQWSADAAQALAQAVQGVASIIDVEAVIIDAPLPRAEVEGLVGRIADGLRARADRMLVRPKLLVGKAGRLASARGVAMVPFVEVLGLEHPHGRPAESGQAVAEAAIPSPRLRSCR